MSMLGSIRRQLTPIHPEGYIFIAGFALATLVLGSFFGSLFWIGAIATAWCAYFFRDPVRLTPLDENLVISRSPYAATCGLMIIGRDGVNAAVLIEFLIEFRKRLIKNAGREIFLIVDRGSAHRAKGQRRARNCACSFCRLMGQPATLTRWSGSTGKRIPPIAWR